VPTPSVADGQLHPIQVERFRADLLALTGADPGTIGVAVSGGADSLAMLLLAEAAFPGQIRAATVDHCLRVAAAEEAAYVARICTDRGIPHTILTVDVSRQQNLSDAARTARYAALEAWRAGGGISWIATAHHADDQLETIVMRLNRSSGLAGLAGIRAANGQVIRPLLGWRQSELAAIVEAARITPVVDPSNVDDRYDRARVRKLLSGNMLLDAQAVARSAALLGEAEAALEAAIDLLAERIEFGEATAEFSPARLSFELQRRLVSRCLAHIDPAHASRGQAIARVVEALLDGRPASIGRVLARPVASPLTNPVWHFGCAPERRLS